MTFGWDYPAFRNLARTKGIPHTCLVSDSCGTVSAADEERLDTLIHALPMQTAVRRG
jgi:hypothetical protein